MASYTRQSSFSDGDTISASLFNNEYNQLVTAFSYASSGTTGHRHDGTAAEGGNIHTIGDQDFLNKIVVDSSNNRWGFYVEVSAAAVEQVRIQDGAIVPVTTNDIDLGTASLQFKDIYIDGTANIDSLTLTSGATVTVILDEDNLGSDSATALATQQSIKAYVDSQFTGQTLEFSGDSGGTLSIDLDSETLTLTGGTGIDTTGSLNDLTIAIDSTVVTLTGTQTLTNKTLTTPVISSITNTGTLTLPTSTDTLVGRATTDTLTNKTISSASNTITINLGSATVTGTLSQFNTALSDGSFVSLAGSETLTNKTLTSPTLTSPVITTPQINDTSADHQYVFAVSELAADRTVTLPLLTGNDTFVFESHTQTLTNKTLTTPVISSISNSGTVTLPTGTTTLVGTDTSDVLTNKTISGASNTLSNIGNSSLTNSSVSFGGVSVSLGGSDATPAFDLTDASGYLGDSNLVTTGTISSGVWQGTAVADAYVANDLTISGGTVDNTVIGGTTAAAGTFTSLNVTGDLTVSGTTTTVNSTTVTFDDIVLTLGGDTAPSVDDNKDRGLEFRWHNGTAAKLGFFGYDDSASVFTFIPDATDTLGAYSGTVGDVSFGAGTFASDVTLTGASYNVVWDSSDNALEFADNAKAVFGAGNDLQIYHVGGSASYVETATNDLYLKGFRDVYLQASGANSLTAIGGGATTLLHNGSAKLATTSTGINVTGAITADTISLGDYTDALTLGASNDLSLYHDGANSQIKSDTGSLILRTDAFRVLNNANSEQILHGDANGAVTAYYDNTARLATTSTGIDVTGTVTADGLTVDGDVTVTGASAISLSSEQHITYQTTSTNATAGDHIFKSYNTEIMRIDGNNNRVGIGTSSPSTTLHLKAASGNTGLYLQDASGSPNISWLDSAGTVQWQIYSTMGGAAGLDPLIFYSSAGERMRIDSAGNVGIGTASPNSYAGYTTLTLNNATNGGLIDVEANGTRVSTFFGTASQTNFGTVTSTPLVLITNNAEAMRIDSSGQVGIGVVPTSGWSTSSYKVLDINTSSIAASSSTFALPLNAYNDGFTWRYKGAGVASSYYQASGNHVWQYAASGTAGNAISFSEAMRIDSSGHVIAPYGVTLGTAVGTYNAANTLDDYEEGTWTPAVNAGSISGTSITYSGTYTKVGRLVLIHFKASNTTGDIQVSSYVTFSGFPFNINETCTGTVITEDIDQFSRQGFAAASGTVVTLSACGSATGTTSLFASIAAYI